MAHRLRDGIRSDEAAILNSAIWAAYGDALGFITELTDRTGLKRRTGNAEVDVTVDWRRVIGGRFGTEVLLPAGTYSDDTQLRLATCRSIRGTGEFDPETFAKIELTVWPTYALGGGRGTKAAAANLSRSDVNWFSNFFAAGDSSYVRGGGNGAAMRIQPHVWCAVDRSRPATYLKDVVRNSLCTHGHPRGILGAVFHAVCLAETLNKGAVPGIESWLLSLELFSRVSEIINDDRELGTFWLPTWEAHTSRRIEAEFAAISKELRDDIIRVRPLLNERPELAYSKIVESIGGFEEQQRGSGTKTALLASALAWVFREASPDVALVNAANELHSDTDTICTMAGALLGVTSTAVPRGVLRNRPYIEAEAQRLFKISQGELVDSFGYPDLFSWTPPKTQGDSIALDGDHYVLLGLGPATPKGAEYKGRGKDDSIWQWMDLSFGQTILAKRRKTPPRLRSDKLMPTKRLEARVPVAPTLPGLDPLASTVQRGSVRRPSLDDLTREAIHSDFLPSLIGRHLMSFADQPDGIEQAIAYASILLKARMSRLNSKRQK